MIGTALLLTLVLAAAVACGVVAVSPPAVGLATRVGRATGELGETPGWWDTAVGRLGGRVDADSERDLALFGTTPEAFTLRRLRWVAGIGLLAGLMWPLVVMALGAPPVLLPVAVIAGGAAGWPLAAHEIRQEAAQRRREARLALSQWLQLVAMMMLSGTSLEQAMRRSAAAGSGWLFEAIASALQRAEDTSRTYPSVLRELGEQTDIAPLREVAVELRLALDRGAGVAQVLTDRATQLRADEVNDQLADAEAAGQRVAIPMVGLALSFLAFIAWPAIAVLIDLQ